MKIQILIFVLSVLFLNAPSSAQGIPDSLMEHVWYGAFAKSTDSTQSRYRFFSRVSDGVRYLFVEKVDYGIDCLGKTEECYKNRTRTSTFSLCCDELFPGMDKPSDPQTTIVFKGWKSYNSLILKVGSTTYLIRLGKLPLTDIHAIDEKGNIIDLPPDE